MHSSEPSAVRGRHALATFPLARQMLEERELAIVAVPVDRAWEYARIVDARPGWSPFRNELHVAARSAAASWMAGGFADVREHNQDDALVNEMVVLVHDYLHVWAVAQVRELVPELQHGTGAITPDNAEKHVYCMLLEEAVATVGLDYWYFATIDFARLLDCGTSVTGFSTTYHESMIDEARRFVPGLEVQAPAFFSRLVDLYCSGVLRGFAPEIMARSPVCAKWLEHELDYSRRQRGFTRLWIQHMAGASLYKHAELAKPVAVAAEWRAWLADEIGCRLWEKVKDGRARPCAPLDAASTPWRAPDTGRIDFRFTAVSSFESDVAMREAIARRDMVPESLDYLLDQCITGRVFAACPEASRRALVFAKGPAREALVAGLLAGVPVVGEGSRPEPDLFFLT